jgi:hypothetical protein
MNYIPNKLFAIIVILITLCACSDSNEEPADYIPQQTYQKYFINAYYTAVDSILSSYSAINYSTDDGDYNAVGLWIKGQTSTMCSLAELENVQQYLSYAEEFGDKYNRWIKYGGYSSIEAMTDVISTIHVYTNQDFSTQFLRGDDISQLFDIYYFDIKAYLENGFECPDDAEDVTSYILNDPAFSQMQSNKDYKMLCYSHKRLSDMDFSSKRLISSESFIVLKQNPDTEGDYSFTIKLNCTDGKVITTTTTLFHLAP